MQKKNLNEFNAYFLINYMNLNKNFSLIKNTIEEKSQIEQKYKTELCKKFQSTGKCPYGNKCKFAHGKAELVSKIQGANYKKKHCKTFYEKGYCPYGSRCNFQHDERKFKDINLSYFYLQLLLQKKIGLLANENHNFEKISKLVNGRLPVFENLNLIEKGNENVNIKAEDDNDKVNLILNECNSSSTKSNISVDDNNNTKNFIFFKNNEIFNN